MIIKCLSRTGHSQKAATGQLLQYIFKYILDEKKQLPHNDMKPFIIRHNIRSRSLAGYIKEFEHNRSLRIHTRSNNAQIFHTILSFSNLDKRHMTDALLKDVAMQFISLRGKSNLYIGTKHTDKDHIHLHIAHSSSDLSGKASRISRSELHALKVALDGYQKEHYAELVHSLPAHGKSKELRQQPEYRRTVRMAQKDMLLQSLMAAYEKSGSLEAFLTELRICGHEPYYRAGKLTGIKFQGETKYRLAKLGYDEQKIAELDVVNTYEAKELAELRAIRGRSKERGRSREDDNDRNDDRNGRERVPTDHCCHDEEEGSGEPSPMMRIAT